MSCQFTVHANLTIITFECKCITLENYLINNIIEVILRLFKIKISNPISNKPTTNNTLSSESWFSLIHSQQIEFNALSICCSNFRVSKLERKWHTNYISKCMLRGMSYRQWIRLHPAILSWSHMLKKKSERERGTLKRATRMSSTQTQYIRNVRLANRYGHNFHYMRKFNIAFRQSLRRKTDRTILHTERERERVSAVHTINCACVRVKMFALNA